MRIFEVGNLNPKTFEFREFCRVKSVNDFLSNQDIFPAAIF